MATKKAEAKKAPVKKAETKKVSYKYNSVEFTGYVVNPKEIKGGITFGLSVANGQNEDGTTKSFIVNVVDFNSKHVLINGDKVNVSGRLTIEDYNKKKYTKVFVSNIKKV